ncbi:hypothetical protein MJH12_19345, partial [bacterium]|nr:hypothetical protein [bacterium]
MGYIPPFCMITVLRDIIILIFFCVALTFLQSADENTSSELSKDSFLQSIKNSEAFENKDPLLADLQNILGDSAPDNQVLSSPTPVWVDAPNFSEASFPEPSDETFQMPKDSISKSPKIEIPKEKVAPDFSNRKRMNLKTDLKIQKKSIVSKKIKKAIGPDLLTKTSNQASDSPPGFDSFRAKRSPKIRKEKKKKPFHKLEGVTHLDDSILLNFVDTELGIILKTLSDFLEKTFILSPKVKSKITVINPNSLNKEEAYEVLLAILELSDFAVIEKGSVVKIFPK